VEDSINCQSSFVNEENNFCVIIDDDGRVVYAYLLDDLDNIISDVWLYNRCEAPETTEWQDKSKIPFANPKEFVKVDENSANVEKIENISVEWFETNNKVSAKIFLKNKLIGILMVGIKPGWAYMAQKDGPLAKVLEYSKWT
jgi:hypothetical protein